MSGLRPRKSIPRKGPPRARKKRTAAELRQKREREYGPLGYHEFLTARPCCACGRRSCSEFAHVGNEGAGIGRKANGNQGVPLCRECHRAAHDHGQPALEYAWDVDLKAEAAHCWSAWLAFCGDAE